MKADRAARHTTSRRAVVRLLVALCLVLGLLLTAAPAGAIDIPFDPLPIPGEDACNNLDAPIPASPHGFGSFIINPGVDRAGRSSDPFAAEHPASLESVYGTSPQWFTFDIGCTGQFMAGAGTALGNILLELGGILPNWSHLLLHSVLSPGSWLIDLEKPVLEATGATTQGVWSPWLPIVLLLVAVLIFLRARAGRAAESVSAAAWALLLLGLSSMLISYPVEIVHMVDDGVRNVTGLIATGFNDGKAIPADSKDLGDEAAVVAVDAQFDEVIRTTQYRAWVTGVFGSPDSQTAIDYGPKVFAATHFTWEEYAAYREDPEDAGARIVEKKADAFKTCAEQIKESDSLAYEYFTGEHWSQRLTTSLVNLAVLVVACGFLLFAGLASLLAFALIRLIVPFAPVMGVLFMIDRTRDAAVAMLKRVIGPLVMGPVCFLVGLLLLRFFSAILSAETMWFVLKLGLIGVLTYLASTLLKPHAYTVTPLLNHALAPLRDALALRSSAQVAGGKAHGSQANAERRVVARTIGRTAIVFMPPPAVAYTNPDAADFVAYAPPQRALEASQAAHTVAPLGPLDLAIREEIRRVPAEEKSAWSKLFEGYPRGSRHSALEKARWYADAYRRDDLLPQQYNFLRGSWYHHAAAHHFRATEVSIHRIAADGSREALFRVDAIDDDRVVSLKNLQIADASPETVKRYINEMATKYRPGRPDLVVAPTDGNRARVAAGELLEDDLDRPMRGRMHLGVPPQAKPIPEWVHVYAAERRVRIREYEPHPDAGGPL